MYVFDCLLQLHGTSTIVGKGHRDCCRKLLTPDHVSMTISMLCTMANHRINPFYLLFLLNCSTQRNVYEKFSRWP